jgi:hypothetical protein
MGSKNRTLIVTIVAIACFTFALTLMSADECYVAAPAFLCTLLVLWLAMSLWDRDNAMPLFDVGLFCAIATCLYTNYPLVNYWSDGLQFGPLSDSRLQALQITPVGLGVFHLRHVAYLGSFIAAYSTLRGRSTVVTGNVAIPTRGGLYVLLGAFIALTCYFLVLQAFTGASIYASYETEEYAETREAFARLPLLFLQISGKLAGIYFVLKLALLLFVVSRCRRLGWRCLLLTWILLELLQTVATRGGRTGLILFLLSAGLFYHRLVRPLTFRFLALSGSLIIVFFVFFGLYRAHPDIATIQSELARSQGGILSAGNEFQALLGTALDVQRIKELGASPPWIIYLNDIVNILPPQQLLPFTKLSAADWYLQQVGLSGNGTGLMWGVMAQSIIGFDWAELVIRGAFLGSLLAWVHRWYARRSSGFLETLFYSYLCIKTYYTFRDTTLSVLTNVVWEMVPCYLLLKLGVAILPETEAANSVTSAPMLESRR